MKLYYHKLLAMKSPKRILILITGILIAILLILFTNQEFEAKLGLDQMKKPKLTAPASGLNNFIELLTKLK